ncbi:MAG: type II secretion system F family protein [Nitrospirae bacterium]|nr:type II secretion system F family protein [Nitrospirota bacterium]
MSFYSYRATSMDGTIMEGVIEAADESAAFELVRSRGLIPLKLVAPKESSGKKIFSFKSTNSDLLMFTTELSALLSAGLPIDRSLNILSDISESAEMRKVIQNILKAIREGGSFSDALQRHPDIFPRIYVNMVRAGESGGVIDAVLEKLNEFLETSKELKDSVFSAMIYPLILSFTGGVSVIILLTYVLPKFSGIFSELGSTLPASTQLLLSFSSALQSYWWIFLTLIAVFWIIIKNYNKTPEGKLKLDSIKLKLLRDVITKLETARFCRTLGTLIKSGVPLLQALRNSKDVISNLAIATAIDNVSKGAKEGKGIAAPLTEANVFPQLALSMIKVGEETGQLDVMLMKVAVTYEKSLRVSVRRVVSLIEPAMILIMGLIIGFIVLSMLMAIFSITDMPF